MAIIYSGTTWTYFGPAPLSIQEDAGDCWTIHFDPHHGETCWCHTPVHRVTLHGSIGGLNPMPVSTTADRRDLALCSIIANSVINVIHDPCGCGRDPYIKRSRW